MALCTRCRERLHLPEEFSIPAGEHEEGKCYLCGGILDKVDEFFNIFREESDGVEFSTFLVGLRVDKEHFARDRAFIESTKNNSRSYRDQFQYLLGIRIEDELGKKVDFLRPEITFTVNETNLDYEFSIRPVYIIGRYLKLKRGIPQSPWIKPGKGRENEKSVSEYIGESITPIFRGRNYEFFASGREDVDALMVGTGRPFYLQIEEPRKRDCDFESARNSVIEQSSGAVDVLDLRLGTKDEIEKLKKERFEKTYEVGLTFEGGVPSGISETVDGLSGKIIRQKTPTRVLPIRADRSRERTIKYAKVVKVEGNTVIIRIRAEAGTYIKELITGDMGRTVPNLTDLTKVNVKIDYLNVLEVN